MNTEKIIESVFKELAIAGINVIPNIQVQVRRNVLQQATKADDPTELVKAVKEVETKTVNWKK